MAPKGQMTPEQWEATGIGLFKPMYDDVHDFIERAQQYCKANPNDTQQLRDSLQLSFRGLAQKRWDQASEDERFHVTHGDDINYWVRNLKKGFKKPPGLYYAIDDHETLVYLRKQEEDRKAYQRQLAKEKASYQASSKQGHLQQVQLDTVHLPSKTAPSLATPPTPQSEVRLSIFDPTLQYDFVEARLFHSASSFAQQLQQDNSHCCEQEVLGLLPKCLRGPAHQWYLSHEGLNDTDLPTILNALVATFDKTPQLTAPQKPIRLASSTPECQYHTCVQCSAQFSSVTRLMSHTKLDTCGKPTCKHCEQIFESNNKLHEHIRNCPESPAKHSVTDSKNTTKLAVSALDVSETPAGLTASSASTSIAHITNPVIPAIDDTTPAASPTGSVSHSAVNSQIATNIASNALSYVEISPVTSASPAPALVTTGNSISAPSPAISHASTPASIKSSTPTSDTLSSPVPAYRTLSPAPPTYTQTPRSWLTIDDLFMRYAPLKAVTAIREKSHSTAAKEQSKSSANQKALLPQYCQQQKPYVLTIQDLFKMFEKQRFAIAKSQQKSLTPHSQQQQGQRANQMTPCPHNQQEQALPANQKAPRVKECQSTKISLKNSCRQFGSYPKSTKPYFSISASPFYDSEGFRHDSTIQQRHSVTANRLIAHDGTQHTDLRDSRCSPQARHCKPITGFIF